jgi:hypothetical protein
MVALHPLQAVHDSAAFIAQHARHVHIDAEATTALAHRLAGATVPAVAWDTIHHFNDGTPRTAQYLLVLDSLNFCFWPQPAWDYNRLALALKQTMLSEPERFTAERLSRVTPTDVRIMLGDSDDIPLLEQRALLLREIGTVLAARWDGEAANLVQAAQGSGAALVGLITAEFPGFRDHAIYKGFPVYFYKRAQIAVGDLWGSFGGEGLGAFHDLHHLTMFADYRVPQILRAEGVLVYAPELAATVDSQIEIAAGSEQEIEIRGMTVYAVERLRAELKTLGITQSSVELDWLLWNIGEARQHTIAPHHNTLTIYY